MGDARQRCVVVACWKERKLVGIAKFGCLYVPTAMNGLEEKMTHFMVGSLYQPLNIIGEGAYSVVCSAIHLPTQHKVTIKRITLFNHSMFCLCTLCEIKLLCHFHHENIISILGILCPPLSTTLTRAISSRTMLPYTSALYKVLPGPLSAVLWQGHMMTMPLAPISFYSHKMSVHLHNPIAHA